MAETGAAKFGANQTFWPTLPQGTVHTIWRPVGDVNREEALQKSAVPSFLRSSNGPR